MADGLHSERWMLEAGSDLSHGVGRKDLRKCGTCLLEGLGLLLELYEELDQVLSRVRAIGASDLLIQVLSHLQSVQLGCERSICWLILLDGLALVILTLAWDDPRILDEALSVGAASRR